MSSIDEVFIIDQKVKVSSFSSIEHDDLNSVTSIVLHRTASSNIDGTLNAYKSG